MAKTTKIGTLTKLELIKARTKVPCGTFPGQNRARKFKNRKKDANKKACRGKVKW